MRNWSRSKRVQTAIAFAVALLSAVLKLLAIVALATVGLLAAPECATKPSRKSRSQQRTLGKAGSNQERPNQGNANAPTPATVNEQAPASTAENKPETEQEAIDIQRKLEWFTGVLAVVGVLQVGAMIWQARLLRDTLKEIHTQAGQMERQTGILEKSVAVAETSAKAANAQIQMIKAHDRARLDVKAEDLRFVGARPTIAGWGLEARITLSNIGRGRAYISSSAGRFVFRPFDVDPPSLEEEIAFSLAAVPEFIDPETPPVAVTSRLEECPSSLEVFSKEISEWKVSV